jgi:polysaccharide export outer membrane protein
VAPGESLATDGAYRLGPGDRIRIDVFKVPQYSGENQVLVDGSLNLPQVGSVRVEGLTLKEAGDAVSAKYAKILRYPFITVTLLAPRPIRVAIAGEVSRPGAYNIPTSDTGLQLPTVTRALQLAGGITRVADVRQVEIRRPQPTGGDEVIRIDLWEFLQSGNSRRDVTLRSGDTVYVPAVAKVDLAESVQLSSASFAAERNQPLNIAVVGEVFRPGPYLVTASARTGLLAGTVGEGSGGIDDRPPTVTRAIQLAGGIKPLADIRQIQIRRFSRSGAEQTIDVDLWKLLKEGDLKQDLILQDRDTVIIPTATAITPEEATQLAAASFSPDNIQVNVVGEVIRPGTVQVPPNTPLNQALLAAGGFNQRARRRSVELIRLNPNGSVIRRTISVDLASGINEQNNPTLRKDDIIVVNRSGLASVSDALGSVLTPLSNTLSIFNVFTGIFRLFGSP